MKSQAVVSRCGDAYDFSIRAGGGFGVRILGLTETEVDRLIRSTLLMICGRVFSMRFLFMSCERAPDDFSRARDRPLPLNSG